LLHLVLYPGGLCSPSNYIIISKKAITSMHVGEVSRNRYLVVMISPFIFLMLAIVAGMLTVSLEFRVYFKLILVINFSLSSSDIISFFIILFKTKKGNKINGPFYYDS
jgi:hypothetical protein